MLIAAIFVSMYGISTVASQLDTVAFLSKTLPHGMIRAIFVQGAIAAALFAPLAVLALGKWRAPSIRAPKSPTVPPKPASIFLRLALLIAAFVFLYMFFGYLRRLEKPRTATFLRGVGAANLLGGIEAQLDKLPLDLRPCRLPRSALHRVPVPAGSDARHFPAGVGFGRGTFFSLLDNRLAVAESVDARQCCAEPFLGDAGLQLGLRRPRRMALVLYCARTPGGTETNSQIGGFKTVA
jgi:hypothetical protein